MARSCSTLCLPADQDAYRQLIDDPRRFRAWLDRAFRDHPELFPTAFAHGYTLKDSRVAAKTGLRLRRLRLKATGQAFSVRPSFVLPYATAYTDDVRNALFVRSFGVPFWALARVFGHNRMFWYRLEASLGRNSVVGTTVRQVDVPPHLVADEHHQERDGVKNYIATTVGGGCCLGAEVAVSASLEDLQAAYEVFKQEAQDAQADYQTQTINTDGWASTYGAWQVLFPCVAVLRCFLHSWLNIRKRAKHLGDVFRTLGHKVWHAYRASNARQMSQRLRRLGEWAKQHLTSAAVREEVDKLCSHSRAFQVAYGQPEGQRTSVMLDRVMRSMNRYFEDGQHLHGSQAAATRHSRAWALLYNFRPWSPATTRVNQGWESPAERLNRHRYHDDWLQNLLISASLGGFQR